MNPYQQRLLTLALTVWAMISSIATAETPQNKSATANDAIVASGYAREMPPGVTMGVAYLSLHNPSQRPRALRAIELPEYPKASAALHTTVSENGVNRMRPLSQVTLPAGGDLEMQPGATHLMLHGITLRAGQVLQLRLVFADGEDVQVSVPVRSVIAAQHSSHGNHHRHHDG